MVGGLAQLVAVAAESRLAPRRDAWPRALNRGSHGVIPPSCGSAKGAVEAPSPARSTTSKDPRGGPSGPFHSAPPNRRGSRRMSAASSSNGGGKPSGKPAVHADDRARGNTLWGSKPCDSPCGTLSDSPSGTPCAGTRTGSSRPPPSPDRRPLHLMMTPARGQAETLVAVPPGQKPLH